MTKQSHLTFSTRAIPPHSNVSSSQEIEEEGQKMVFGLKKLISGIFQSSPKRCDKAPSGEGGGAGESEAQSVEQGQGQGEKGQPPPRPCCAHAPAPAQQGTSKMGQIRDCGGGCEGTRINCQQGGEGAGGSEATSCVGVVPPPPPPQVDEVPTLINTTQEVLDFLMSTRKALETTTIQIEKLVGSLKPPEASNMAPPETIAAQSSLPPASTSTSTPNLPPELIQLYTYTPEGVTESSSPAESVAVVASTSTAAAATSTPPASKETTPTASDKAGEEAPPPDKKETPTTTPPGTLLDTELPLDPTLHLYSLSPSYSEQARALRTTVLLPYLSRSAFLSSGQAVERGLLLTGTSLGILPLVHALANELTKLSGLNKPTRIFTRSSTDTFSRYSSSSEELIKKMSESAEIARKEGHPVILLVQDLPSFYSWCSVFGPCSSQVQCLQTEMAKWLKPCPSSEDQDDPNEHVFFIGTAEVSYKVMGSLRQPGLFGKEIECPPAPDDGMVAMILKGATARWKKGPGGKMLLQVAKIAKANGFTHPELVLLAQAAFGRGIQKVVEGKEKEMGTVGCCAKCGGDSSALKVDESSLAEISPLLSDWEWAVGEVKQRREKLKAEAAKCAAGEGEDPRKSKSKMSEMDASLTFASVGGLDEQVLWLRENIIVPLGHKEVLSEWGIEPVRGIVFHGPPGTGKTLLAKALVNELNLAAKKGAESAKTPPGTARGSSAAAKKPDPAAPPPPAPKKGWTFFYQKSTDCFNKYVGETEKNLRKLFATATAKAPSLIFFDEFDGLAPARTDGSHQFHSGVVTTLLGLMDSVKRGDVLVVAATNRLDTLDPAMRRAGRFDRALGFSMPGEEGRLGILKIHSHKWKQGNEGEVLGKMAKVTVGFSGADLEQLTRQTLLLALRRMNKDVPVPVAGTSGSAAAAPPSLVIQESDWFSALSLTKPSGAAGVSAFGGGGALFKPPPPGVDALLRPNISTIHKKLNPILDLIQATKTTLSSTRLNTFLISSSDFDTKDVHAYLIPLLFNSSSSQISRLWPVTLDLSELAMGTLPRKHVLLTLSQVTSPPVGKIGALFVPHLDQFLHTGWDLEKVGPMVQFVLTQLAGLRGENVVIVGTSRVGLKEMEGVQKFGGILDIFKDNGGSASHSYTPPGVAEVTEFLKGDLDQFPAQLEAAVGVGVGGDVPFLLDFKTELYSVLRERGVGVGVTMDKKEGVGEGGAEQEDKKAMLLPLLEKIIKEYAAKVGRSGGGGDKARQHQMDMYI